MEIQINTEEELIHLYRVLSAQGAWTSPRGEDCLELENFTYVCRPRVRFNAFQGRALNVPYIKREMAWYINADPFDTSIAQHAAQWGKIVLNGKLNSNYGSYWFGQYGVKFIVNTLKNDPWSRRAVIPMYGSDVDHMDPEAKDVPCTLAIEFRIRSNKLHMHAIMRSQDILWGMANDLPTFSFLQEIVAALLGIDMGNLTVTAGSFHVYKSRLRMFDSILASNKYTPLLSRPPVIQQDEANRLIEKCIDPTYAFSRWLLDV